ncbi:MAG TPA: hypothetical protein VJM50_12620 [Pyrinomonadaceae bacterium]|nr:hypothetical protein [Pyrinomonadaceae bacterium]
MRIGLDVETLEFRISPTKKRPMKVDYLSDTREVLIRATLSDEQSLTLDTESEEVTVSFQKLDLRLSEVAVRQIFEALPPEMLRRL